MIWAEFQKYSMLQDEDSEKKQEYVNELGRSVHSFIRTGVRNSQLDELEEIEEKFHKKYEERFDIGQVIDLIKKSSQEKMKKRENIDCRKKQEDRKSELIHLQHQISFQVVMESVTEVLEHSLEKLVKDAAYLSHVNMLYELYEQEEKLRREEREFENMSAKYQKLADISKKLSEKRRMELKELENQVEISEQELGNMFSRCEGYFNVRPNKDKCMISLTPTGKRFREYIVKTEKKYDDTVWNQLIYKNCNNIIDGFKKSYRSGTKYKVHLDGFSNDYQRAVRHNYYEALKDMIDADYAVLYDMDDIAANVRRSGEVYGRYEFRISNEWDE